MKTAREYDKKRVVVARVNIQLRMELDDVGGDGGEGRRARRPQLHGGRQESE